MKQKHWQQQQGQSQLDQNRPATSPFRTGPLKMKEYPAWFPEQSTKSSSTVWTAAKRSQQVSLLNHFNCVLDHSHADDADSPLSLTEPEAISNPNITNITPSSLSLAWTEPEGERSFFKVQWTDGNHSVTVNTTSTSETITNLTAGVKYNIAVSAVALDGHTEGEKGFVSNYTCEYTLHFGFHFKTFTLQFNSCILTYCICMKVSMLKCFSLTDPEAVRNLSVTEVTTSSLFVSWTKPEGQSSSYRVQWTDGNVSGDGNVFQTFENITNLTAGVQYTATVTAVAGDGLTEGHSATVSQYTSKYSNMVTTAWKSAEDTWWTTTLIIYSNSGCLSKDM